MFAKGFHVYKLFWVFLIAGLLGNLIEMIFNRVVLETWVGSSGVVYGYFSIVWGLGAVIVTLCLGFLAQKRDLIVILFGTVLCGVYEYICCLFQEYMLGMRFSDYTDLSYTINGKVNLLYCVLWGILAMFWVKDIYPLLSGAIEKIPATLGNILTWLLMALMIVNIVLTTAALVRMDHRREEPAQKSALDTFLDLQYPDDKMLGRFVNLRFMDEVPPLSQEVPLP